MRHDAIELIRAMDVLPEPHLLVASDGRVRAANAAASRDLAGGGTLVGDYLQSVCADPPEKLGAYLARCARTRSAVPGVFGFKAASGMVITYRCEGGLAIPAGKGGRSTVLVRCHENRSAVRNFVSLNDQIAHLSAVNRKLIKTQDQLRDALASQEMLYRELQHRVKNNLQILTSILTLSATRESDPRVRAKLHDTRDRVKAIAAVHAVLYEGSAATELDAVDLARRVTNELAKAFGMPGISASVEDGSAVVDVEAALSIGLIISELVSNAYKYAFANRQSGRINVALERDPSRVLRIVVADNGIGISSLRSEKHGFGLECVRTLAGSFDGDVDIQTGQNGTTVRVILKNAAR